MGVIQGKCEIVRTRRETQNESQETRLLSATTVADSDSQCHVFAGCPVVNTLLLDTMCTGSTNPGEEAPQRRSLEIFELDASIVTSNAEILTTTPMGWGRGVEAATATMSWIQNGTNTTVIYRSGVVLAGDGVLPTLVSRSCNALRCTDVACKHQLRKRQYRLQVNLLGAGKQRATPLILCR